MEIEDSFSVKIPMNEVLKAIRKVDPSEYKNKNCVFSLKSGIPYMVFTKTEEEKERKDKLKKCFGGYEKCEQCTNCFLSHSCNLVTNDYIAETLDEEKFEYEDRSLHIKSSIEEMTELEAEGESTFVYLDSDKLRVDEYGPHTPKKIEWRISKNGNPTALSASGKRITVFQSKIAEYYSIAFNENDKTKFFDGFESQEEAKTYAEEKIFYI